MAGTIGLNDVAKMLSTRGDISTIGGAIGCMTAMISSDAREKENTTGNDVKKIKEFICGGGESLSEMFKYIRSTVEEQTKELRVLLKGDKNNKPLVKSDIKDIVKSATLGIEEKLSEINKTLIYIAKSQRGIGLRNIKNKTEREIEEFKQAIENGKNLTNTKFGQILLMLNQIKMIKMKDLPLIKLKIKEIKKLANEFKDITKSFRELKKDELERAESFILKLPSLGVAIHKSYVLLKKFDFESFNEKILGLPKKKEEKPKSGIFSIVYGIKNISVKDLSLAEKNSKSIKNIIKSICLGVTTLVVFSPVIFVGALLVKPLQWALFGNNKNGDGGIFGLFKKIADKSNVLKNAVKSLAWFSLGLVTLGAGLGLFFKMTKNVDVERFIDVGLSTLGLYKLISYLGKKEKDFYNGLSSIIPFSIGLTILGVGLGLFFKLTKNVELGQMLLVAASTVAIGGATYLIGKMNKSGGILEGSIAMGIMGICLIPFGISMKLLMGSVKGIKWKEFGILATTILTLGGAVLGLGALMITGIGAVAWGAGIAALSALGLALIPFGIGMKNLSKAAKDVDKRSITNLCETTKEMLKSFNSAATKEERRNARKNINLLSKLSKTLNGIALGIKEFNKVEDGSIDKAKKSLTELAEFFFSKKEGSLQSYSLEWENRRKARKGAHTIGIIGKNLKSVATSLKIFNEVADSSIDKMMDSLKRISEFFFSDNAGSLPSYSLKWSDRRRAKKEAHTIGVIGKNLKDVAISLKLFNEVADSSIDKMKKSLINIAEFFFSSNEGSLPTYSLRWADRRRAKKESHTIGVIGQNLKNLAESLKIFNEIGPNAIDKMKDALQKVAEYFFAIDSPLNKYFSGWIKRKRASKNADTIGTISNSLYKLGESLKLFNESGSSAVDTMKSSLDKISDFFFSKNMAESILDRGRASIIGKSIINISETLSEFNENVKEIDIKQIEDCSNILKTINSDILAKWDNSYFKNSIQISSSMKKLVSSFDDANSKYFRGARVTERLFKEMTNPNFSKAEKTILRANDFVGKVNTLDITKAKNLTDMFKSFASIGKVGGLFNSFDKRVQQFTKACIELINAINGNTDALNNGDETVSVKDENGQEIQVSRKDAELMPKQMTITNIDELAQAIADQLNSLNVDCDANVNLQINNESGNEWRISRM